MNNKKIVAGLLALTFVLGGAALPNKVVSNNAVILASAEEETEVLTFGDFEYTLLEDGTVEIARYIGSDTEVEIPGEINGAAVTSIGERAFYAMSRFNNEDYVVIDYYEKLSYETESEKYKNIKNITSVVIPGSVTEIKESAFEGCISLESITLPQKLKYIGKSAFFDCENIKSIVIPDSVKEIGFWAFSYCLSLESITLPKDLKCIDEHVFAGCETLKNIVIPDGVEKIELAAFADCCNIESIVIPDSVKTIGRYAFYDCDSIESLVIPDSVEIIENGAFEHCSNLRDVTLPKGLKKIDAFVFAHCDSLKGITFPEGVEEIGERAFVYSLGLENFVIPDSVKTIGEFAFSNCHNLKSITIPASVTDIGDWAFVNSESRVIYSMSMYKPSKDLVINCCKDSAAHKYALKNGNNFNVIDAEDSKTKYPKLINEEYNAKYRQFRLNWTAVEGAEEYGIAVKLAGKWKVQAYTDADTTTYTSPKLTSGQSYQAVICAKVNGKWDTSVLNNRAFPLVVR
ncbi:leucine-rich repeat domain-containing protein [Ruminococcus albus]|uniref:Leucine rich repeat-containing protein n=1 Tax=Ruminococcus albus TaxID=1264 RepID=A0A1I1EN10_RUMAL|nr:leucine-rich repeat domain-containing protein [Ruminococcus albus]SFB88042.1 Leucine rich repeat-containing protein [Ruminococcus albus]